MTALAWASKLICHEHACLAGQFVIKTREAIAG
jgi:hypothetical protein